jgi:hypothetical protein
MRGRSSRAVNAEEEDLATEPDLVSGLEIRDMHGFTVDARAIGAVQVINPHVASGALKPRMAPGDIGSIETDGVVGGSPNRRVAFADREDLSRIATRYHLELDLIALRSRGLPVVWNIDDVCPVDWA